MAKYIINNAGTPEASITISKATLEEWKNLYIRTSIEYTYMDNHEKVLLYTGKTSVMNDLLSYFEEGWDNEIQTKEEA